MRRLLWQSTALAVTFSLILSLILSLIFSLIVFSTFAQQDKKSAQILESVQVNWWQVPVFAVDISGAPVTDLKEDDIEVFMNNRRIEGFTFYKRTFNVSGKRHVSKDSPPPSTPADIAKAPLVKNNTIFLLFDLVMSADSCTKHAKDITHGIISGAEKNTRFIVLTIEPFKGLNYICGPTANKQILLRSIKNKVIRRANDRVVKAGKFFGVGNPSDNIKSGSKSSKKRYSAEESRMMEEMVSAYYQRKNDSFFSSFESLYLLFNSISDNKFVYFFTEGISTSFRNSIRGGKTFYNRQMKKSAQFLSRSGAVLFIVNPMGVHNGTALGTVRDMSTSAGKEPTSLLTADHTLSGEDSLRYLAEESGGKYLEGVNKEIVETLDNMHRAYYEISFPDIPALKGATRRITVKSKRKGISVHTLRSLEKSKRYGDMNNIEKEIFMLNLVSGNPLHRETIDFGHASVTGIKTEESNGRIRQVIYHVTLPKSYVNQSLELYKFWVRNDNEVLRLEKESFTSKKRKVKLSFDLNKKSDDKTWPYFALVNRTADSVRVRLIGDHWVEDDDFKLSEQTLQTGKNYKDGNPAVISGNELKKILEGTAIYCMKLKESAFHFVCKEEIVETHSPLTTSGKVRADMFVRPIDSYSPYGRRRAVKSPQKKLRDSVNKYRFFYRLLKNGNSIKEERDWLTPAKSEKISSHDNKAVNAGSIDKNDVISPIAFVSERAVFAPITMLGAERREKYIFRFIRYDERNGRRFAVIEGIPRNPGKTAGIFGKVYIDLADFSVIKIEANPKSINGYPRLLEQAQRLNTRLFLSLEIEFDKIRNGIRFPTQVTMKEKYQGGRNISRFKGPAGWERMKTLFKYSDYRFFDIQMDVTYDDTNDNQSN